MTNHSHYPRIEIYSEIDKGNPDSGSDQWTDPNGHTVFGGKIDDRPHVLRKTYLISEQQKTALLETELRWLPYFGIQKEDITLGHYFQAAANTDRYPFYNLLPQNLNHLLTAKEKDDNYAYYNTMLVYEESYPNTFTVVWLDENTWFVNEVYYSANGEFFKFIQEPQEDIVAEAKFDDFLRLSPIFQYKLTEGFPSIKLHTTRQTTPLNDIVLGIALSPGMPNTTSYSIQIAGDASIMQHGFKSSKRIDPNKLTDLLLKAQKLDWESYNLNKIPAPFAHDKQVFSISVWKNGRLYAIQNFESITPTPSLMNFTKEVQEILEVN